MRNFIILGLLFVGGCDWYQAVNDKINPPSAEELEDRRQKEEEAKQDRVKKIKEADSLVQSWAEDLHTKTNDNGGYQHHEGITEADPWGKFLKVEYSQDSWDEVLTVTSSGPDQRFGTSDDLKRERRTTNLLGILKGVSTGVIVFGIWMILAVLAFVLFLLVEAKRKKRGKSKKVRSLALALFASLILAPIFFVWYCFMYLGLTCVDGFDLDTEFFDSGLSFDLDLDLDVFE